MATEWLLSGLVGLLFPGVIYLVTLSLHHPVNWKCRLHTGLLIQIKCFWQEHRIGAIVY